MNSPKQPDKKDVAQFESVADWIARERGELTFGVRPQFILPESEDLTLADLESNGRAGNAVLLAKLESGDLWWCDPEGRATAIHRFALVGNDGKCKAWLQYIDHDNLYWMHETRPLTVSITDGTGKGVAGLAQVTTLEWHGEA
jgi:hypothetical protein